MADRQMLDLPVVLRAARSTYIVFAVLTGIPLTLGVLAALLSSMGWIPVLIPAAATALALIWIRIFRLEFQDDRVCYTTLFAGLQIRRYDDLKDYVIKRSFRSPYGPTNRLTLLPKGRDIESLAINIKIFSMSDVTKMCEILDRKLGTSRSSRSLKPLSEKSQSI